MLLLSGSWCASRLGGEGRAVCEEGPLVHRIKRRKMAGEMASEHWVK